MESLSIEDVVATSDDAAVRRAFEGRNLIWLSILLIFFFVGCLLELFTNITRHDNVDVAVAASNAVLILLLFFLLRDVFRVGKHERSAGSWRIGRWLRDHVSAMSIAYMLAQYSLSVAFARHHEDFIGWAMFFPFFMLGFRLLTSELVLIHAYLLGLPLAMAFLNSLTKSIWPITGLCVAINAFCLAIEIVASMRLKNEVATDWRGRRRLAREQVRMRDELQYARQLQVSMLPECAPRLDWIDVAGASLPATEVGGDYFDYFMVGNALAIVEGDVAGHGLASGIVLASLRSGFTLLRDALTDPAAVLQRLHDLVAETSRRRILVTSAVLLLDPASHRARIASAGHPPIVVRNGAATTVVDLFGPPLGVRLPMTIAQHELAFGPGDVFVLHTDGVYESTSPTGEPYGIERIVDVVRRADGADASAIRDAILRDVEEFRGGEAADDDVTVVVARVTG